MQFLLICFAFGDFLLTNQNYCKNVYRLVQFVFVFSEPAEETRRAAGGVCRFSLEKLGTFKGRYDYKLSRNFPFYIYINIF